MFSVTIILSAENSEQSIEILERLHKILKDNDTYDNYKNGHISLSVNMTHNEITTNFDLHRCDGLFTTLIQMDKVVYDIALNMGGVGIVK